MTKSEEIDIEMLKIFYVKGFSNEKIAKIFNCSVLIIRDLRRKYGLKRNQKCRSCGVTFEYKQSNRRYCDVCQQDYNYIKKSTYFAIVSIRQHFAELVKTNPKMAKKIYQDMKNEDGNKFTEMALDGILENKGDE